MDGSWLGDDDRLLAELGEAMRAAQEVPDRFIQAGKSAFAWHDIDSELARLVSDTAGEAAQHSAAGMRSERAVLRSLTFATAELTIDIDVQPDALRGQVVPSRPGTVQVRGGGDAVQDYPIDELGWFVIRPVPTGPYRLSVQLDGGPSALTDWI